MEFLLGRLDGMNWQASRLVAPNVAKLARLSARNVLVMDCDTSNMVPVLSLVLQALPDIESWGSPHISYFSHRMRTPGVLE